MRAGGEGAFLTNTGVLDMRSIHMPCFCLRHAVRRGKNLSTQHVPKEVGSNKWEDGGCRRAVRLVGARAGPYDGAEAIAGCVDLRSIDLQVAITG